MATESDNPPSSNGDVEEERIPILASEVPALLAALESTDNETFERSVAKLTQAMEQQQDLFIEHVMPKVPHFLQLAAGSDDEERRHSLLDLASQTGLFLEQGRTILQAHLRPFIAFLLNSDTTDRFSVVRALEEMLDQDDSFEEILVTAFKEDIFNIVDDFGDTSKSINCVRYTSAVEFFYFTSLYGNDRTRTAATKAAALEFVINATSAPDAETRVATAECLALALTQKEVYQEQFTSNQPGDNYDDPNFFHGILLLPIFALIQDSDQKVAAAALDVLQADDTEQTRLFVSVDDNLHRALVLQLAKKDPSIVGATVDWLLARYTEGDASFIAEGFRQTWTSDDVDMDTKMGIVRALANNFDTVRQAANKGGLVEFIITGLQSDEHRVPLLNSVVTLMGSDQVLGSRLVKGEAIPRLLDIFEEGKTTEERSLAASVLALLPESYSIDEGDETNTVSFREGAVAALTDDNVFPRILRAIASPDTQIKSAALSLLAKIFYKQDTWNDEDESSLMDRLLTEDIVEVAVSSLDVPDVAPAALELLSGICYEYSRGFKLLQKAFAPRLPTADATFFAALYGQHTSRAAARRRHRVADAALKAGGLTRVLQLLEEPVESIESRRLVVEAFRVILCADSADTDVGRTNTRLPVLLAELIADGTFDSLKQVNWMVRLLSVEDKPEALATWTVLANEETVQHLVKSLHTELAVFPEPDAEVLSEEECTKVAKEYREKSEAEQERFSQTISVTVETITGLLVPHFAPFTHILAAALLTRSNSCDESGVVQLLGKLASSCSDGPSLDVLVAAAKDLLALPTPPEISKINTWVGYDPALATTFYLAGVVDFLLQRTTPPPRTAGDGGEEEEEPATAPLDQIIDTLAVVATNVKGDTERKRDVQRAFFNSAVLLSKAVEILKNLEDYEKYAAQAMAPNVFKLSQGFSEAIPLLVEQDIAPSLLKMYDDEDLEPEHTGPLLGWLAEAIKDELVAIIKQHIAQLQPPTNTGNGAKGGGKKKKKKAQYSPRIGKDNILLRLKILAGTSDAAREAILDAGGFELIASTLDEGSSSEARASGFKALTNLVEGNVSRVHDLVLPLLPRVSAIFQDENTEESNYPFILQFLQAFIKAYDIQPLLQIEFDLTLVTKLSEEPSSVANMSVLVATVGSLIHKGEEGKQAVTGRFKDRFQSEAGLASEANWGTSHALRCLANDCEVEAKAVLDAGSLDYAIQLLKSDDIQHITKGASLATTLARRLPAEVLPLLQSTGILQLVAEGRVKFDAYLETPFVAPEGLDESEVNEAKEAYEEKQTARVDWKTHWDNFSRILSGETVSDEEYEEYQWF